MDIHLYALSTCPYCRMTKRYLDDHGITYTLTEVDMLEGDEKQAAIDKVKELSGGTSFPGARRRQRGGRGLQQVQDRQGHRLVGGPHDC